MAIMEIKCGNSNFLAHKMQYNLHLILHCVRGIIITYMYTLIANLLLKNKDLLTLTNINYCFPVVAMSSLNLTTEVHVKIPLLIP